MLDLHANLTTPGAVLVLGVVGAPAGGDGQSAAGVPVRPGATLVGWGYLSATADSIARVKLSSPDMVDPVNGIDIADGATSLKVGVWNWCKLPYNSGVRSVTAGTNVGVVAGSALLLDSYPGNSIKGSRAAPNMVIAGTATTFGAALVANTWGTQPYAPASALPAGKYAILGFYVSAITNVAAVRFSHADFGGYKPGLPCVNANLTAALGIQLSNKDAIWTDQGYQFVEASTLTGEACCPVFTVTTAGTGLTIEAIAAQACTPVVTPVLCKVG